jgi:oxygen-independent coproporphyrinogen-3 oxidase
LSFALDPEISIECNPGSLDKAKAQLLASFVNRVSVGVQSFDDELLNVIGRRRPKSFNEIERTVEELRAAGIRNIGVDLIYGIPGQTIDAWRRDLELALLLRPEHISAYSLSVEEGTRLAQNGARPVDDDLAADMWDLAGEVLAGAGLPRYEVSNYAALPHECRHNQDVWHGRRYLGLGPSASSFDGVRRWTELAPIEKWLSEDSPAYDDLPPDARAREIFVMGLRTASGWSQEDFRKVSDFQLDSLRPKLEDLSKDGLLTLDKGKIAPTRKGLAFWNSIAEELL